MTNSHHDVRSRPNCKIQALCHSVLIANVKTIVSTIYAKEYQQRVNSEYSNNKWTLIKTIEEVKKFISFIKKIKTEERGAQRSTLLDVRKSITSLRQFDLGLGILIKSNKEKLQDLPIR